MCAQTDHPPYDDPEPYDRKPTTPRRYVLAGAEEPRPSIALAILGEMLNDAEHDLRTVENSKTGATTVAMARAVADALRRARNKVADAEARR